MDEFRKIELESSSTQKSSNQKETKNPAKRKAFIPSKKTLVRIIAIAVVPLVIFAIAVGLPAYKTYQSAQKTYLSAKKTWTGIKNQNIAEARSELEVTKKDLAETQKSLHSFGYVRFIPIINNYYNDADHLVQAGLYGLDTATTIIESIEPYADVLGLKGQGSFVGGSAEQRIQTAILTLGKITPRIDDVSKNLVLAKEEVDNVDPNHYPTFLGIEKVKSQLVRLKTLTDEGVTFIDEARPLIKIFPELLGEKEDKKYLVIFQNDKELRPTGGFITAYSVFRMEKGVIHVDRSDDIYTLDDAIARKPKAPEPILNYLPKVTVLNIRDSNLSPDFEESMKTFRKLYESSSAKTNIDGIIALDTHVLISTIKILDDEIKAGGFTFTTEIDKRCDCPKVIYELENNISRPVNYVRIGRKDLLGMLLYAIMEKALKSSPKAYWGPLIQQGISLVSQKHILFYLYEKEAQAGIEALNAAGKIKPFEGDYFHMNEANFAGAKANLYVKENVEQEYSISSDGTITKTVTFNYKNDHPPSDCDLERGGLCLNATLRDWFRIYVPKGSELIDSEGSEVKVTTGEDLGKTVFEGYFTVRPLGQKKLTVKYRLPFKLAKGSPLPVLVQKQPGTDNNGYVIKVNGKEKEKFELLTDKELRFKI